jgi:hypothetical protein
MSEKVSAAATPGNSESAGERFRLEAEFLTEKQLLEKIPTSRRTLFDWRATGKIPFIRLGGQKVIYHWESVRQALLRAQKGD